MDNLILQLLLLIGIACLVSTNRRVILPNPSHPSQCFDGKKAFNVGKYYPQTHRVCKQMICREDFTLLLEDCGVVEVPDGYRNVPDLTKRFPDCCINITKLENATKIDANQTKTDGNQTKVETSPSPIRIDVINPTTIDGNTTKFENVTKIEENVINDNPKKLR